MGEGWVQVIWFIVTLIVVVTTMILIALRFLLRAADIIRDYEQFVNDVYLVLDSYRDDLKTLTKGEVLSDHPEVTRFVRRNSLMVGQVDLLLQTLYQQRANRGSRDEKKKLPRPDVI